MNTLAEKEKRAPVAFSLVFAILVVGIGVTGYVSFRNYERQYRVEVERQLSAIAELKVSELAQWRKERLADANILYKNAAFSHLVARFLQDPADTDAQQQLQAWLEKYPVYDQYDQARLLDPQGATRLSVPAGAPPVSAVVAQRIPAVLESGQETLVDFYKSDQDQRVYLATLVPILDETAGNRDFGETSASSVESLSRTVLGIIVLRIDPETYLYPYLSRWPTPSETAETLLIRRDGNDALFLNELKFQKNTALNLRIPLESKDTPAVKAALGQTGIVEGVDYRGVPVIADVRAVPDSPWFLVAKIDTSEVYAPLRARVWEMAVFFSALLLGAGAGVVAVWRQQRISFYRERYEAAEALRDLSAYNRNLLEVSLDPLVTIDHAGKIADVNVATEQVAGYSRQDLIGADFSDYFTEPEKAREGYRRVFRDGTVRDYPLEIRHRDGHITAVLYNATVYRDESGQIRGVLAAARDITERKQAEEALRQANVYNRSLIEASLDPLVTFGPNGKITDVNVATEVVTGHSRQDLIGTDFSGYFVEAEKARAGYQQVFREGLVRDYALELLHRDGRVTPVLYNASVFRDEAGQVIGVFAQARDITERKRAEEALRESETKFRTLFENMTEGVALHELIYDESGAAVDYRVLDLNPAYEKHTGLTQERARGMLGSALYGTGAPPYLEEYERVARTGAPFTFETYFPPMEKHFSISVICPKPGQFATVFEDVTERRRQEEELRRKDEELVRFTYTVSHDLKSPLVTFKTFMGYLEHDLARSDAGRVAQDLQYMGTAADKMGRLLDELLEMSRIGRVVHPPTRVTFRELVDETLNAVAGRLAEQGVAVQVSDEPVTLWGDRSRLAEIWQNLVENAVKFMGDQAQPRIELGAERRGEETVFFVRDNGVGIDPRHQSKVFGLFEKLDPKSEGTGLGLALVKRIVELHAGKIWVESRGPGQGATFLFTLPGAVKR